MSEETKTFGAADYWKQETEKALEVSENWEKLYVEQCEATRYWLGLTHSFQEKRDRAIGLIEAWALQNWKAGKRVAPTDDQMRALIDFLKGEEK